MVAGKAATGENTLLKGDKKQLPLLSKISALPLAVCGAGGSPVLTRAGGDAALCSLSLVQ